MLEEKVEARIEAEAKTEEMLDKMLEGVKKRSRTSKCGECGKKLRLLMEHKCKCCGLYCVRHKYPEDHSCTYDYRDDMQRKLTKENPKIIGEKLTKI